MSVQHSTSIYNIYAQIKLIGLTAGNDNVQINTNMKKSIGTQSNFQLAKSTLARKMKCQL